MRSIKCLSSVLVSHDNVASSAEGEDPSKFLSVRFTAIDHWGLQHCAPATDGIIQLRGDTAMHLAAFWTRVAIHVTQSTTWVITPSTDFDQFPMQKPLRMNCGRVWKACHPTRLMDALFVYIKHNIDKLYIYPH